MSLKQWIIIVCEVGAFLFGSNSIIEVMKFDKKVMLWFLKLQKQLQASNI
jgi:hypothetical protein